MTGPDWAQLVGLTAAAPGAAAPGGVCLATGVGGMPGDDFAAALGVALDEVPDLLFLPELAARGPEADLIGRSAAVLADLPVDLQPSGWRLVARPGRDLQRSRDLLERDLDTLARIAGQWSGPLKIAVAGPWTLAAGVQLPRGGPALRDPGAVRDIAASLAQGLSALLAGVRARVPGARLVAQLDEPGLPAVLTGSVPTDSGFSRVSPVDSRVVAEHLGAVLLRGGEGSGVHCCADEVPFDLLQTAGAAWVSLDWSRLSRAAEEELGQSVDSGLLLLAGVVDPRRPDRLDVPATVAPVLQSWNRLGFEPHLAPRRIALSPVCGLSGAGLQAARAALRQCREAARHLEQEAS